MEIKGLSFADQMRMVKGVESITPKQKINDVQGVGENTNKVSFSDYLKESISEVNKLGIESDQAIQRAVEGKELNPHDTMIALQKADLSFRLMMSVKSRLEQAYEQLIRMPIG